MHADHRRIGLDTKAYDSGVLSALRLEGRERTLLQAVGPRRTPSARYGGAEFVPTEGSGVVIRSERLSVESSEVLPVS